MANEATVFSLTSTEQATGSKTQLGLGDVDVATKDADAVATGSDVAIYFLKDPYEATDGKSQLLEQIEKLKAAIVKANWPAV